VDRKAAGIAVLAVVLLVISAMSSLVAAPHRGVAIRAGASDPPAVGSCGELSGSELTVVDCSRPHSVEVVFVWSAGDPAGPPPTFADCADKVRDYVGSFPAQDAQAHPTGRWSLPLRYRHVLAAGPDGLNLDGWSWQACLVAPMGPAPWTGYQGQVRNLPTSGPASSALRVCYADPGSVNSVIPCTAPHSGEMLATQPFPERTPAVATSLAAEQPQASCEATARLITGADDPTFQGQIRVAVYSDGPAQHNQLFSADIGVYYTSAGVNWSVCVVESVSGRKLTDSLAGIGSAALPFG
jgi:hypothetical protein